MANPSSSLSQPNAASPPYPVRSMTGFAAVRRPTPDGELSINLRCVNHRGLDLHLHLGGEFARFENEVRALLKGSIRRGHVELRASLARGNETPKPCYDREALLSYVAEFRKAANELELRCEPDLNVLFTFPGVLSGAGKPDEQLEFGLGEEFLSGLRQCAEELNAFRGREGEALRSELSALADQIETLTKNVAEIRADAVIAFRQRLQEKLSELLQTSGVPEVRLAEEAAVLADRSDIQEELTRLTTHSLELKRLLDEGGEIGKRIDFLLQEMNRETNTLLAKSAGVGEPGLRLTNLGLSLKANIERIREQALNLE